MRALAWEGLGQAIWQGDALAVLREMPEASVQCIVTSPPYYGLRAYGTEPIVRDAANPDCAHEWRDGRRVADGNAPSVSTTLIGGMGIRASEGTAGAAVCARCGAMRCELGAEPTVEAYVRHIVAIFREAKRVLRADGILWCVIADSYASHDVGARPKSLLLVPERLAIALADDGWTIRSRVAWVKQAPMPESVQDRFTSAWEHVWMLAKQARYYFDQDAVREPIADPASLARHRDVGRGRQGYAAASGLGDHPQRDRNNGLGGDPAGRNRRNVLVLPPEPLDLPHFAAFPRILVRILLAASTSAAGCCPRCRKAYRRCVERVASVPDGRARAGATAASTDVAGARQRLKMRGGGYSGRSADTTAWSAACSCAAGPPRPCRVLDPFVGSGTTLVVARELGLEGWGIELSPEYVTMASKRVDTWRRVEDAAEARGQARLFAEGAVS